ncbi:unnamed protein product [Rhizoctonia solani]|uniref:peptidylprolyl isomerase n=1 Tax=Rhizoctonia solani TaxID=456999 RepID=A0A8H3GKY0_9AGAM|nr:unnamed protein product [Rhizoctonia solani]
MGVNVNVTHRPSGEPVYPKSGDKVEIHYVGRLGPQSTDKEFDSSRKRNSPFQTVIGVGIPKVPLGGKATLEISPDCAYGEKGIKNTIPPNSTLYFEVELLAINGRKN